MSEKEQKEEQKNQPSKSKMSESFQKEEDEAKKAELKRKQDELDNATVVFFAPAEKYSIANFHKEEKQAGVIVRPEGSIAFTRHLLITNVEEEITFVRKSNAFRAGIIKECKNMTEARELVLQVMAVKSVTEIETSSQTVTTAD